MPRFFLAALAALAPVCLFGQEPARTDSTVPAVDTIPAPDPNAPHTEPDSIRLPVAPSTAPAGPLPHGTRLVFDRDSVNWSGAETLADILARVPGVYVARGGTWGQPEVVHYGGRGSRSIDVYWDGLQIQPMGRDSVYADVTQMPLAFAERIEVLVLPASFRVDVVTRRQDMQQTQSAVRVLSGKFNRTAYDGIFQHRYASGFGISVGFHWKDTDGANDAGGARDIALWAKTDWTPSERFGASYQFMRVKKDRDGGLLPSNIEIVGRDITHRQDRLSFFLNEQRDGIGWRFDALAGSQTFSGDSGVAKQTLNQVAASATYRRSRWSGWLGLRSYGDRISLWAEAGLNAAITDFLTISAKGERARLDGNRSGTRVSGTASLALPGGLWLRGAAAVGDWPQVPSLETDAAVRTEDLSGHIGWKIGRQELEVGLLLRDAYQPVATPEFTGVPSLGAAPPSEYISVRGEISPLGGITLGGWFEDPLTGGADFAPPRHARLELVLRSKYWRTFRSGAFDVEFEVNVESWGTGTAGLDSGGSPIVLPGATFWGGAIEIQLLGFQLFWYVQNFMLSDAEFVPGYPLGRGNQLFGARWAFTN